MSKTYNKQSLYFTDRKEYYRQKEKQTGSLPEQSSNNLNFSSESYRSLGAADFKKAIGFTGVESRYNNTARVTKGKYNDSVKKRYPILDSRKDCYNFHDWGVEIREVICLLQKAWREVQILRNTIETMVEFSTSEKIHLKSKNKSALAFYKKWLEVSGVEKFQEQFYREYYRSGNIPIYTIKGKMEQAVFDEMKASFGAKSQEIPYKYTILNPAQIGLLSAITSEELWAKMFSSYEIKRLRNPQTAIEKKIADSLDPKIKKEISSGRSSVESVYIPLDSKYFQMVFNQKQDYEPFAIPLFYGVLEDIELKLSMKEADKIILASVENMILLVKMGGYKGPNGEEIPPNPQHLEAFKEILSNNEVRRVLVADSTTQAEFIIPDLSKAIGKEKYEAINSDIREGLQVLMSGGEKFSNLTTKAKLFIQKLNLNRRDFKDWLRGEFVKIADAMNFRDIPEIELEEISLDDPIQTKRVITRFFELGLLTPEETVEALETGLLPKKYESIESQKEYKELKHDDLYYPQQFYNATYNTLDPKEQKITPESGRPSGTNTPQDGPRAPRTLGKVGFEELRESFGSLDYLQKEAEALLKQNYNRKKLNKQQKDLAAEIVKNVVSNNPKEKWDEVLDDAIKKQKVSIDQDFQKKVAAFAAESDMDNFLASLVLSSQVDEKV